MFRWMLIFLLLATPCKAQQIAWPTPEAEQLYTNTRTALASGNFRAAIAGFQQVISLAPDIMQPYRDLGNAYYLSGNYAKADATLGSLITAGTADEQTYAVAAASLGAQRESKKARKLIEKGLDRYPHSGLLYHDYGKLYDDENNEEEALKKWVAGIKADPAFRVNYYEAARTYMLTNKLVWAILYGEIFVNLEPNTPRSGETRKMLLAAYRKLYNTPGEQTLRYGKADKKEGAADFESTVTRTLLRLSPIVSDGITTENLTMLRTRFTLQWQANYAAQYPYTLFSYWDECLKQGYFDAYSQWLFAKAENPQQYEAWQKFHADAIPGWLTYSAAQPLLPAAQDAYNEGRVKGIFPNISPKR